MALKSVYLCILIFLIFAKNTSAYIDPGSGSYLFQILVSGLISFLFFYKSIIRSITSFIEKKIIRRKKNGIKK